MTSGGRESPPPPRPPDADEAELLRSRLLRLDRVDAALRAEWSAGGFTDDALAATLRTLTERGMAVLREAVTVYGWPGRAMVGAEAAGAASRLLQHAEGETAFRRECLALIGEAAERGDMPTRDVAYLTDTLLLAEGHQQRYGTKFAREPDGRLRPLRLADPEGVDARRAAAGLEPLDRYAALLNERFPAPVPDGERRTP